MSAAFALAACDNTFGLIEVASTDARGEDARAEDGPALPADLVFSYPLDTLTDSMTHDLVQALPARCTQGQCPATVVGHSAGALDFDGVDDMLRVDATSDLSNPTGFTASAWVWLAAKPFSHSAGCVVGKRVGSGGDNSWQLCVMGDYLVLYSSLPSDVISAGVMPIGEWHHVAARWDGTTKSIWLDGVMRSSVDLGIRSMEARS